MGDATGQINYGNFLDAGSQGVFYWQRDWNSGEALLQTLDLKQGRLGEMRTISFSKYLNYFMESFMLLGGDEGLLLSTANTLYHYDLNSGESEEVLCWNDGNVNIDGTQAERLRDLRRTTQGDLEFEALLLEPISGSAEIANISYVDQAFVPQRQVVLIGMEQSMVGNIDRAVRRFNRQNAEYRAELVVYDTDKLTEALMYGKGDLPDLMEAGSISLDLLQSKGLLESLKPYFEKSQVVGKDDILKSVWEAGCINGDMVRAVTCFSFDSLSTSAETITEPGWTAEELLALQQDYPDARLLDYCFPFNVFRMVIGSRIDDFLDWDKGKAHVDTKEFVELLETLASLNYPEDPTLGRNQMIFYEDVERRKFLSQIWLINFESISSPYSYQKQRNAYGNKVFMVGYPSADGNPLYWMNATLVFSIYAESQCKDGAWAFIEFVQRPSHRDGTRYTDEILKEEYAEELRFMAEYMVRNQWVDLDSNIRVILTEETDAFFAGDKTAQETADLIQNRVQLFLDEQ